MKLTVRQLLTVAEGVTQAAVPGFALGAGAQDGDFRANADRIVFLKDGTIVEETQLAARPAGAIATVDNVLEAR